jgi:TolB-like protein/tetratricopeptide (TPR) repeat protein
MPLPETIQPKFQAVPENSIAILPFEVCDGQDLNFLVGAGIATEVLNRLAERARLKVLGRASSFAFAGFGLPMPQIAESLGVQHVLTGVVCRDNNRLTLSAELSDAKGFVIWGGNHTQVVSPSGKITQTLASVVATEVAAELGDLIPAKADALMDKLAYEQLLIGREHNARGDKQQARAAFERALEKQPNYAEAQYEIALLELKGLDDVDQQGTGVENARSLAVRAETLVKQQLEYDAGSAHAHYVAGRIISAMAYLDDELLYRHSADLDEEEIAAQKASINNRWAEAEQHYRISIRINPTVSETYSRLAGVVDADEALEIYEQAQIRDPFNVGLNINIARNWAKRGRYQQAIELLERFKVLPEIPSRIWFHQLELAHYWGYPAEKSAMLIEMLQQDPGAFTNRLNRWHAWWFVSDLAQLGLLEEAEAWKARIENIPITKWMRIGGLEGYWMVTESHDEAVSRHQQRLAAMGNTQVLNAWTVLSTMLVTDLISMGELERAIKLMQSIQHAPKWHSQSRLFLVALLQLVGRDTEASPVLEELVADLETTVAAGNRNPEQLVYLAEAYARQQRDEEAIDMLQKAVDYHWRGMTIMGRLARCGTDEPLFYVDSYMPLEFDQFNNSPTTRLKGNPRVIALCEQVEADLEQQTNRIRTMLAQHDFEELLAPLMAMAEDAVAGKQ